MIRGFLECCDDCTSSFPLTSETSITHDVFGIQSHDITAELWSTAKQYDGYNTENVNKNVFNNVSNLLFNNTFDIKAGVKKSLVLVPGTSWISGRTSINFHPNVLWTSKKFTDGPFFLDKDKLFGNRTSKNFDVLARGTSENF